jgi:hypothetical protein
MTYKILSYKKYGNKEYSTKTVQLGDLEKTIQRMIRSYAIVYITVETGTDIISERYDEPIC